MNKKVEKLAKAQKAASTFGAIAEEYFSKRERETAGDPFKRERNRFDNYLKPVLGSVPIADVTPTLLLAALRKPEAAGKLETARDCARCPGASSATPLPPGAPPATRPPT